uniref:3-hydroxyisobutyryl-CoA hydrolase, mitochondrial n=1 Tax=Lepeophtheirus salmonis TaxID=72036 RepID=C1BT17_LEPSM|nr:3-hydroxyisobutyryl-CoA hydrolase, mitochondrial precursor [Lepeophtheirus salmonis]ADD24084.1 3-hydroxyisobutyryl-CoA hydrolase, mitochondrial [Lepeophtheirus salmonis]
MFVSKRYISHLGNLKKNASNVNIISELKNGKGIIKLNRPKKLNALNLQMVRSINDTITHWYTQGIIDSLIIDSVHPSCFSAGGDIINVISKEKGSPDQSLLFKEGYELSHAIDQLNIPVITIVNGLLMGGGIGLTIHSKYRIATESTVFSMPEVLFGFFPDTGSSWFLPRMRGELGTYIGMTGYQMKASDTYHSGIATHMCPQKVLPDLRNDLESVLPDEFEKVLNFYHDKFPIRPFSISEDLLTKIDYIFGTSKNTEEIIKKLKPSDDDFSSKTLETFSKGSPKSLEITFQLLKMGKKATSLGECLNNEYNSVLKFLKDEDVYEGVRALLVDKDFSPNWSPKTIEEVVIDHTFFKNEQSLNL